MIYCIHQQTDEPDRDGFIPRLLPLAHEAGVFSAKMVTEPEQGCRVQLGHGEYHGKSEYCGELLPRKRLFHVPCCGGKRSVLYGHDAPAGQKRKGPV